jgi:hypothetical protein
LVELPREGKSEKNSSKTTKGKILPVFGSKILILSQSWQARIKGGFESKIQIG